MNEDNSLIQAMTQKFRLSTRGEVEHAVEFRYTRAKVFATRGRLDGLPREAVCRRIALLTLMKDEVEDPCKIWSAIHSHRRILKLSPPGWTRVGIPVSLNKKFVRAIDVWRAGDGIEVI